MWVSDFANQYRRITAHANPLDFQYFCSSPRNDQRKACPHPFSLQLFRLSGKCGTPSLTAPSCAIITKISSRQSSSCSSPTVLLASGISPPKHKSNSVSVGSRPRHLCRSSKAEPGQKGRSLPGCTGLGLMLLGTGRYFEGRRMPVEWQTSPPRRMKELGSLAVRARPHRWPTAWPGVSRR